MGEWVKKGTASTLEDVIEKNCGMPAAELLSPEPVCPRSIRGMEELAGHVRHALAKGRKITVVGDYDADGVTSAAILHQTMASLGRPPSVRIPRRLSEGYGLSMKMVGEIDSGLVITVDNGISAIGEIAALRAKGVDVCVLDHHLPGSELPDANVVVDPHIDPAYSDRHSFRHYCGAGLSYKLAELMLPGGRLLDRLAVIAAVGTVADVAPLIGDNRAIVRKGIDLIRRDASIVPSIAAMNEMAGVCLFDEESIGYKIGPMLNAGGRMDDDGAKLGFWLMAASKDSAAMRETAEKLYGMNEDRKKLMADWDVRIREIVDSECLYGNYPLCVFADIPEGITGPIAGRLAEGLKTPVIVLARSSSEPGVIKGSGRTYGGADLRELIRPLDGMLTRVGGHASAVGLSLKAADLAGFLNSAAEFEPPDGIGDETVGYDLEIRGDKNAIAGVEQECRKYAPFGECNPKPVFMARNVVLSPRYGQAWKTMGADGTHLKLHCDGFDIVAFGMADRYINGLGEPLAVDFVGTVSRNRFQYRETLQVQAIDLAASGSYVQAAESPLLTALAARNAAFAR